MGEGKKSVGGGGMKQCLTCNEYLKRGHGYKTDRKYCNYDCYSNRSLLNPDEIIELLNRNDSVPTTAGLLGVTSGTLYRQLKKLKIKRHVKWVSS